jgi:hypothetical protein
VHEVTDPAAVPRQYLMVNDAAIKAAIAGGVRDIPGVRIYEDVRTAQSDERARPPHVRISSTPTPCATKRRAPGWPGPTPRPQLEALEQTRKSVLAQGMKGYFAEGMAGNKAETMALADDAYRRVHQAAWSRPVTPPTAPASATTS